MSNEISLKDIENIPEKFKAVRNALNMNQKDFAKTIGIGQGYLSNLESGEKEPSDVLLIAFKYRYGISDNWLRTGQGNIFQSQEKANDKNTEVIPLTRKSNGNTSLSMLESDNQVMIPKYDIQASAGYGAYNSNEPVGQISLDRVFIEKELRASYRHLTSITVVGDSMEPTLRNGDVVIVDNSQTGGDGIFIVRAGEVLYIKRVQIFFDKGIMRLTSDNGFYEPMELDVKTENVKVVGRVICCLRKI